MKRYLTRVQELQVSFGKMVLTRVPREDNTQADALTRLESKTDEEVSNQQVQILTEPSITLAIKVLQIEESAETPEWANEII